MNSSGDAIHQPQASDAVAVEIVFETLVDGAVVVPSIDLWSDSEVYVLSSVYPHSPATLSRGRHRAVIHIPENFLNSINYFVGVGLRSVNTTPQLVHVYDKTSISFEVLDDLDAVSHANYNGTFGGLVRPLLEWERLQHQHLPGA